MGAVFGLMAALPGGPAAAAMGPVQVAVMPIVLPAAPPAPCPGCKDFVLNLPPTPTTDTYGEDANSTAELSITFPSGWSGITCGDKYGVFVRDDGDVAGGIPVPGWRCTAGMNSLRFLGPTFDSLEESGQRFLFRALTTGPINAPEPVDILNAGFIDMIQTYKDGEQQKHRARKQLQARRPANLGTAVRIDLPADWRGVCDDPTAAATAANIPVDRACATTEGAGDHPRFRLDWATGDPARFFYFEAWTLLDPAPASAPPDLVNVTNLRDMMFENGEIETELVAVLRQGTPFVAASPRPTVTISPSAKPRIECNPNGGSVNTNNGVNGFNNGFNNQFNTGNQVSITGSQGNTLNFPGPNNSGIYGSTANGPGDPCTPPVVVLDPCSGEIFTKEGPSRYAPEDRDLPPGCAYPGSDTGPMPVEPVVLQYEKNGNACLPRNQNPSLAGPGVPEQPSPPGPVVGDGRGWEHEPNRASRSHRRAPLRPAAEPTPPVIMISPEDGGVQRAPGSNDDRVIVAPPNANPEPSLRALLPDAAPPAAVAPPPAMDRTPIPFCDDVALPGTGGGSLPMKMALAALAVGGTLTAGAVYWRKNAPRGMRYSRS